MSYEQRLAAGRKFYRNLKRIFTFTLLACIVGLCYLTFWLYQYEHHSINGAIRGYLKKIGHQKYASLYEDNLKYFTELNSKEKYIGYLEKVYGDKKVSNLTYSFSSSDDFSQYYTVNYNGGPIASLELRKDEAKNIWRVRTVSSDRSFQFDLLDDNAGFSINGIDITEAYHHEADKKPSAFEELGIDKKLPSVTRYYISSFVDSPEIAANSSEYEVVRDYSSDQYYIGKKADEKKLSEYSNKIKDTAIAYCKFITRDGTFYELKQHLYPNTNFYKAIAGFDNQWFSNHDTIEFQNLSVDNILPIGENAFVGSITFDYIVSAGAISKTYNNVYQLFFVKNSQNHWRLTNLIIISDSNNQKL